MRSYEGSREQSIDQAPFPSSPFPCAHALTVSELVTPPLNGMILPGVTRDSILSLTRAHSNGQTSIPGLPKQLRVVEREMSIHELQSHAEKGSLLEMFGAGTAAVVSPVERVGYKGRDIMIPTGEGGAGEVAKAMLAEIDLIQRGGKEHPWSIVC